jgi:hypothetical protein
MEKNSQITSTEKIAEELACWAGSGAMPRILRLPPRS